jgi:Glyoxalase/Bleomycin resistance protein/Dioxygenase superfamily
MNSFGLEFHHLGLAVRRPDEAVSLLGNLDYAIGDKIFDPEQNVNLILCRHRQMPAVEIIYPGSVSGPIESHVNRHANGIVYHICFESADLSASLAAIEAAKLRPVCLSEPRPAILFQGRSVSFYNIMGMGLIEILGR